MKEQACFFPVFKDCEDDERGVPESGGGDRSKEGCVDKATVSVHAVCTCPHTVWCAHVLARAGRDCREGYDRKALSGDLLRGLSEAGRRE